MKLLLLLAEINWDHLLSGLIGVIGSLLLVYVNNWFKNRDQKREEERKKPRDDFQAIIDANTRYRDEVRKDLLFAKEEVIKANKQIDISRVTIEKLEQEIKNLTDEIGGEYGLRERLWQSENRFLNIANVTPIGIFRADKEGKCIFVNKKWTELSGLTAEEAMEDGWKKAVHPKDLERVVKDWEDTLINHASFQLVFHFLRPDGVSTCVHGRAIREECRDNKLVGYIGYVIEC